MQAELKPAAAEREIAELEALARQLDSRYRIPFTRIRFGVDAILGLIPGVGDAAAALPALYIISRAHALGLPRSLILKMLANVGIDTLVGSVPILGSVFDIYFKASRRNMELLRRRRFPNQVRHRLYPEPPWERSTATSALRRDAACAA